MFSLACVSVMLMVIHNKVIMKTIVCAEFWRAVSVLLHLFGALAVLTDCWWPSMTNTLSASSLADQQFLSQRDEWFLKLDRQKESCHTSVAWDSRKVNQIQFETVFMKLNMFGVSLGTWFYLHHNQPQKKKQNNKTASWDRADFIHR